MSAPETRNNSLLKYVEDRKIRFCDTLCSKYDGQNTTKCLNICYDVFTILISLIDFITDILVMAQFYNNNQSTFFIISLIILIIAQLSYCLTFAVKNTDTRSKDSIVSMCRIFITT